MSQDNSDLTALMPIEEGPASVPAISVDEGEDEFKPSNEEELMLEALNSAASVKIEPGLEEGEVEEGPELGQEAEMPAETTAERVAREFREKGTAQFWMEKAKDPNFRTFLCAEVEDWVEFNLLFNNWQWAVMLQVFRPFLLVYEPSFQPDVKLPPECEGGFKAAVREWLPPSDQATLLLKQLLGFHMHYRSETEQFFDWALRADYGLPPTAYFEDLEQRRLYGLVLKQELLEAKRLAELKDYVEKNPGQVNIVRFNLKAHLIKMADKLLPKQKWSGPGRPPGSGHHQRIAQVAEMLGLPKPSRKQLIRHRNRHVSTKSESSETSSRYQSSKPLDTETSDDSPPYNPLGDFGELEPDGDQMHGEELVEQEERHEPLKIKISLGAIQTEAKRVHSSDEQEQPEGSKACPRSKRTRRSKHRNAAAEVAAPLVASGPQLLDSLPGFAAAVGLAGEDAYLFYKNGAGVQLNEHEYEQSGFATPQFPFKPNPRLQTVPELAPAEDAPTFVYHPKMTVKDSEFEPVPTIEFDANRTLPLPSAALLNRTVCHVPPADHRPASIKLAQCLNERRFEVGRPEAYGFYEPLGVPPSERGQFLRPGEPLYDANDVRTAKFLPPGVLVPPSLRLPVKLLGSDPEKFAKTGAGKVVFDIDTLSAVSKAYDAKGVFVPYSLVGAEICDMEVVSINRGFFAKEITFTPIPSEASYEEIRAAAYHVNKRIQEALPGVAFNHIQSEAMCLSYILYQFHFCEKISHIVLRDAQIEGGQRRIIFDFSNSYSAGKLLPVKSATRRNHVSILALGPHLCIGWRQTRSGHNANVFCNSGALGIFIIKGEHTAKFTELALKAASGLKDFCPNILRHGRLKINPSLFAKAGVPTAFTVLRKGGLLSVPINGIYLIYSLCESGFELWELLPPEGLAYFASEIPPCTCVPPIAECGSFNGEMAAAKRALFRTDLIAKPEYYCGLHDHNICDQEAFNLHMAQHHLPPEINTALGHKT